jgi:hypothetical protein
VKTALLTPEEEPEPDLAGILALRLLSGNWMMHRCGDTAAAVCRQIADARLRNKTLTVNEFRRHLGLPAVPPPRGGDAL